MSALAGTPKISVCLAAYNGEAFIAEQIESILVEIGVNDELIIVDDCSTDNTAAVVEKFADARIKLFRSPTNQGYVKTFEQALNHSRGEYIFLSDQDDIWVPGRVKLMLQALQTKMLVAGNCEHFGEKLKKFHKYKLQSIRSNKMFFNVLQSFIGYRLYWGCAMGFRQELLDYALPIPKYVHGTHDMYFALAANMQRSVAHLETNVVRHRLHANNVTPKKARPLTKILLARYNFVRIMFILYKRKKT